MLSNIYTDLAMESRELNPDIPGISEQNDSLDGLSISRISIDTHEAAKKLDKPIGSYITVDAPELALRQPGIFETVSRVLAQELCKLAGSLKSGASVMIAGLGNRSITSDSLGPRVVERIYVTRHVARYIPDALPEDTPAVCAVSPGVLGITGIETLEMLLGIARHTKPDLIIAVDSLASRRAARINTTIQLTDTGICPGSGIGNTRKGINKEVFGVPVIAVGVPLVVHAATITRDVISLMAAKAGGSGNESALQLLADEVISESLGQMIVTPKDIDSIINDMSKVIADAVNMAVFAEKYQSVHMLMA